MGCPMEPLNATLDAPARGVTTFTGSAGHVVHRFIERHRATVTTVLIVILAFVVSIHFPDHGVPTNTLVHHSPR